MSPKIKAAGSLIVLALCVYSISRQFRSPPGAEKSQHHVGTVAATETLRLLGGKGDVVLVGFAGARPVMAELMRGFTDTFEAGGGQVRDTVLYDPAGPDGVIQEGSMPRTFFRGVLSDHSGADAVISFIGSPPPLYLKSLGSDRPALVIVGGKSTNTGRLVQRGLIDLAVANRQVVSQQTRPPAENIEDWFERYYTIHRRR